MLDKYEAYNLAQSASEEDPFTSERYEQFRRYMPKNAITVLDVGAGIGRGGARLFELSPGSKLTALDIVKSRLDRLPRVMRPELSVIQQRFPPTTTHLT